MFGQGLGTANIDTHRAIRNGPSGRGGALGREGVRKAAPSSVKSKLYFIHDAKTIELNSCSQ